MSPADALRREGQRRLRTVEPSRPDPEADAAERERRAAAALKCSYRPPDADFYCWKYGVWYNLMDCCYRHHHRTYSGCAGCGQGSINLRQHREFFSLSRPGARAPRR